MLEDSLRRNDVEEIKDIAPLLRAGVEESYEDVRELLLNFRTRLQDSNLESEMRNVVNKFQRQTGVHGEIHLAGSTAGAGAAITSIVYPAGSAVECT
jgi:two-component system nitrate/nitrite sensor histidine kinase NarX